MVRGEKINIGDHSNKNKEEKYFRWSILFIISLASIAMGIYRDGIASLFPFLQRDFNLTRAQLGLYTTCIYFFSSLFSIFSGQLVDLKGSKWGMISGVLFVGILLILHSMVPNFIILLVLAAFAGIGMSINPSAANKGIAEWFPQKWRSTATGIWSTSYPIGGLLAASLLPSLGILIGWRKAIFFPGILILFSSLIILNFYHEKERGKDNLIKYGTNRISFRKGLSQLIHNIDLLAISAYGFFLGTLEGAILTHFTLFLYFDYGLPESLAGLGFAVAQFGSIVGRPGWGLICDRFLGSNRRKTFLFMGFIFLLTTLVFGLFFKRLNPPLMLIYFLAFLVGCSGRGWMGILLSSIPEMVREEQIGVAVGFSMLFLRVGILLSPPIFGYIADLRNSYDLSWLLLGFIFISASIGQYLFYIKKHKEEKN